MQKHCSQCISFIFHFLGHIEDKLMIDIITIIKNSTLISSTYLLRECHLNHQHCSFLQTSSQGTEITEKKTLTQEKFNLCLIVTLKTNHKGHYFPFMLWNSFSPLSPKSDRHQFSPNKYLCIIKRKIRRINKLVTKGYNEKCF